MIAHKVDFRTSMYMHGNLAHLPKPGAHGYAMASARVLTNILKGEARGKLWYLPILELLWAHTGCCVWFGALAGLRWS